MFNQCPSERELGFLGTVQEQVELCKSYSSQCVLFN